MNIALIGAGRIGQLHGALVAAQPGVDEVLVADVDPEDGRHGIGDRRHGRRRRSNGRWITPTRR